MARKNRKAGGGRYFEHRYRGPRVRSFAFLQGRSKFVIGDEMPLAARTNAEAFIEADKMRRRVRVHALSRSFQNCAQKSDRRSLAIGAGNVNDRRQLPLGMAQRAKQSLHAIE
jgi:hypothetical protein